MRYRLFGSLWTDDDSGDDDELTIITFRILTEASEPLKTELGEYIVQE